MGENYEKLQIAKPKKLQMIMSLMYKPSIVEG